MDNLKEVKKELRKQADKKKAKLLQRFFKTGKGEYAEGDIFLGVMVPNQRKIAKEFFQKINLKEIQELLNSKIHEERLTGLIMLVYKYKNKSTTDREKEEIYELYLKNTKNINNWDLVDLTAPNIVGENLLKHPEKKKILYTLANSSHLWEKRIAVLSTFAFIREKKFEDSIKISEILLKDKHDLIHKAVGWMLREIGKRNEKVLEKFLIKHHKTMPRTMLRYSIEKLSEKRRKEFLNGLN